MTTTLTDKQREKIEAGGWFHASIMIEVQGNDKAHIKDALETMVDRLKKEPGLQVVESNFSDIKEFDKTMFSYSVELSFIAHDYGVMIRVALLYSPSYVEIHEPKEIKIPVGEAQNILVDIANVVTSLSHAVFIQHGQLKQLGEKKAKK